MVWGTQTTSPAWNAYVTVDGTINLYQPNNFLSIIITFGPTPTPPFQLTANNVTEYPTPYPYKVMCKNTISNNIILIAHTCIHSSSSSPNIKGFYLASRLLSSTSRPTSTQTTSASRSSPSSPKTSAPNCFLQRMIRTNNIIEINKPPITNANDNLALRIPAMRQYTLYCRQKSHVRSVYFTAGFVCMSDYCCADLTALTPKYRTHMFLCLNKQTENSGELSKHNTRGGC